MTSIQLSEIGLKAIEYKKAVDARKGAAVDFGDACFQWKQENGIGFIEKHSDEWSQMLGGVAKEYTAIKRAKADERNARERLFRACRRASA